ncbi:MAG: glycosyltransferase [Stellaceae bacterium]
MKVAFLISHPSHDIGGEVREVALAAVLRRCGVDAQVYRMTRSDNLVQDHPFGAPILFFKADEPKAEDNLLYSNTMLGSLKYFAPDVIAIKGFGYKMNQIVVDEFRSALPQTSFVAILGGRWRDESMKSCSAVYYEFEEQRSLFANFTAGATYHAILPKYINWLHLNSRAAASAVRDIDLITIGELIERKKLDLLTQVPAHINVCVVGDGPLRTRLQDLFSDKRNIRLVGSIPNEQALDLLHKAKILLHCADDEGLPRVFGEALACGTPIICSDRLRCPGDFPKECVSQAPSNRLVNGALDKLEDSHWLQQAQSIGRHYMREHHSFFRMFLLFCESLKHLNPALCEFIP